MSDETPKDGKHIPGIYIPPIKQQEIHNSTSTERTEKSLQSQTGVRPMISSGLAASKLYPQGYSQTVIPVLKQFLTGDQTMAKRTNANFAQQLANPKVGKRNRRHYKRKYNTPVNNLLLR